MYLQSCFALFVVLISQGFPTAVHTKQKDFTLNWIKSVIQLYQHDCQYLPKHPDKSLDLFTCLSSQNKVCDKKRENFSASEYKQRILILTLLSWWQMQASVQLEHSNYRLSWPSWPCGSPVCTCVCTPYGKLWPFHRWFSFELYETGINQTLLKTISCVSIHENQITQRVPELCTDTRHICL